MNKKLEELYMKNSKHSNYQMLPQYLKSLVGEEEIIVQSRYEEERLDYINQKIELKNKLVLDIGGNTGFFSFESLRKGVGHVDYFEGNQTHAEFVRMAAEELALKEKLTVFPDYYLFEQEKGNYDIAYLLNVVHHFGDDFGKTDSVDKAKKQMLKCINNMASVTKTLVFQMGFNWCGDRTKGLFVNGTKGEMIDFIKEGTTGSWEIVQIGIAEKTNAGICYKDVNQNNIKREDSLGEFLNRPIFILKSKK